MEASGFDRFYLSTQVGRCAAVLLDRQPEIVAQLQGHVVAGDSTLLPKHTRLARRLQKRSALHVLRRDLPITLQGAQPLHAVNN